MMKRIEELKIRTSMCRFCIEILEKEKDDPRQPEALAHYKAQLDELEAELAEAIRPPDIVVNLKPAIITGKIPGLGG